MKTLDLRALTAEAFGVAGISTLGRPQLPAQPSPTERPQAQPAAPELHGTGRGLLGLPVFCRVTFQPTRGIRGGFEGMELLDPLVSVSLPNNIISTPITGRVGTVKEYVGQSDYAVSIRGILATDPFAANRFEYPLQQVQTMQAMASLGVALPVSGWLLDVFGISSLVVKDLLFDSLPGFTNLQAYELQCLSDQPIELLL